MRSIKWLSIIYMFVFFLTPCASAEIKHQTLSGTINIDSWKSMRDQGVVKQNFDFSCGSASLASVLSGFYGLKVSEKDVLDKMEKDGAASFADLAQVAKSYGFKAGGIMLSMNQLMQLKIPVIVYLNYRGGDHFSVVRGVSSEWVWLGDPSWGNKKLRKEQFLSMWEGTKHKGKALLILPKNIADSLVKSAFFGFSKVNALPYEVLSNRLITNTFMRN
ncbi:MAG: C39 family peptidase [Alcanivoracaceae bacterium]|nr:C39 family peptidase [Alcanivoracaceae bacterium]